MPGASPADRQELIDLLEEEKYRFTGTATDGAAALNMTEPEAVDLCLTLLKGGHPLNQIEMDSGGDHHGQAAYEIEVFHRRHVYIKMLPDDSFGEVLALVLSFKESDFA